MLPQFDIKLCKPEWRNDGLILLTIGRNTRSIRKTSPFEAVIGIDRNGRIPYHRQFEFGLMDSRQSRANTLLIMGTDGRALEMDYEGTVLHQWYCPDRFPNGLDGTPIHTAKLHHTIVELSNGFLASLSIQHHELDKPDGEWTHVMGDSVVIFDRSGKIENEIFLTDMLDTTRYGHDSKIPYWPNQGFPGTIDWSHCNCLIEDPNDGGYLISSRHLDAVFKISPQGELVWILGDATGWQKPWQDKLLHWEGKRPFYHQHDLSFTSNGNLMLFDNGTAGSFPPNPRQPLAERESFVLQFDINEQKMTAIERYRFGGKGVLPYSHYVSGVCELPNGNLFIACSGKKHDQDGHRVEIPMFGVGSMELFEVTPNQEIVFHAGLEDDTAVPDEGWNGFRPEYVTPQVAKKL